MKKKTLICLVFGTEIKTRGRDEGEAGVLTTTPLRWEGNIKMFIKRNRLWGRAFDETGSKQS